MYMYTSFKIELIAYLKQHSQNAFGSILLIHMYHTGSAAKLNTIEELRSIFTAAVIGKSFYLVFFNNLFNFTFLSLKRSKYDKECEKYTYLSVLS